MLRCVAACAATLLVALAAAAAASSPPPTLTPAAWKQLQLRVTATRSAPHLGPLRKVCMKPPPADRQARLVYDQCRPGLVVLRSLEAFTQCEANFNGGGSADKLKRCLDTNLNRMAAALTTNLGYAHQLAATVSGGCHAYFLTGSRQVRTLAGDSRRLAGALRKVAPTAPITPPIRADLVAWEQASIAAFHPPAAERRADVRYLAACNPNRSN